MFPPCSSLCVEVFALDFLELVELVSPDGVLISVLSYTCFAMSDAHVSEHIVCPVQGPICPKLPVKF